MVFCRLKRIIVIKDTSLGTLTLRWNEHSGYRCRSLCDFLSEGRLTGRAKRASFALLRLGTTTLGLLQVKTLSDLPPAIRRNIHIEFSTDHLDTLYIQLQEQGIDFYQPPQDKQWERNMAALDPDGYRVEFAQGLRGQKRSCI